MSTACAKDPALFESVDPIDHHDAARLCAVCPVIDWCRRQTQVAIDNAVPDKNGRHGPEGTWAGQLITRGSDTRKRGRAHAHV